MKWAYVARPTTNKSRSKRSEDMKTRLMKGVLIACGFMLMASAAWADRAEIEARSKKTNIGAISLRNVTVDKALDTIAEKSGIVIKKVALPKNAPLVSVEAMDITAFNALKLVSGIANLAFTITDNGIEVSAKKTHMDAKSQMPKDPFGK